MKIYLFRHAEKASHFHPNPSLSERGHGQAEKLLSKVRNSELPKPTALLASPMKRAQQSLTPLSTHMALPLVTDHLLNERQTHENSAAFLKRIHEFWQKASLHDGVIYACTHSDWIDEALPLIPSEKDLVRAVLQPWMPLQYVALHYENDLFHFLECKRIPL